MLIYLVVTDKTHIREVLAQPPSGRSTTTAHILTSIRKVFGGEEWLNASRETVRIKGDATIWLDVAEFQGRVSEWRKHSHPRDECPGCIDSL